MRRLLLIVIPLILANNSLLAQNPSIKASQTDQTAVIDGKLDESFWQDAIPFTEFKMVEPTPGAEPTEKTEVRIAYNKTGLYFGISCYDSDPAKVTANTMVHDNAEERTDDQISILLDPFQDKRTGYIFIINPKGARSEGLAGGEHYSLGWDGLWEAKCRINKKGWTAEIKIPFKTISFNPVLTSWGLNMMFWHQAEFQFLKLVHM